MLFATYHTKKANNIATLALHRAMYFDSQTDLSDAHVDEDHYLAKIPNVRAWGNSSDTNSQDITLSPMSGIKENYFYPARSANLIGGVNAGHNSYTAVQTAKAMTERYFCVYDSPVGNAQQWSNGNPVFNGWNGPSKDTCESGYYWPSQSMLVFPNGLRQSANIETYSSKAGNQYARNVDSFWGTYSGYDAGYMNASMNLSTRQETVTQSYSYISTTATPVQNMTAQSVSADHIVFVRPAGKVYSANGLNQNSRWDVPTTSNGVSGYNRTDAASFNMRVAVTGKSNTPDVTLASCMMMFKCNGQGYMLRAKIGQDITQAAPIATSDVAVLNITAAPPFDANTLYRM